MWLNLVKAALQTFKILAVELEALVLQPKSSVPYVSSHVYENLPPTNLEWSFLALWGQLANQQAFWLVLREGSEEGQGLEMRIGICLPDNKLMWV